MKRRLFTILSALSLLVCVITALAWGCSQFRYDMWTHVTRDKGTAYISGVEIHLGNGRLFVRRVHLQYVPINEKDLGWSHRSRTQFGKEVMFDSWWRFDSRSVPGTSSGYWSLQVGLWPIIAVMSVLPCMWIVFAQRRRKFRRQRCPERGAEEKEDLISN
jgi:hypothetical protein